MWIPISKLIFCNTSNSTIKKLNLIFDVVKDYDILKVDSFTEELNPLLYMLHDGRVYRERTPLLSDDENTLTITLSVTIELMV